MPTEDVSTESSVVVTIRFDINGQPLPIYRVRPFLRPRDVRPYSSYIQFVRLPAVSKAIVRFRVEPGYVSKEGTAPAMRIGNKTIQYGDGNHCEC